MGTVVRKAHGSYRITHNMLSKRKPSAMGPFRDLSGERRGVFTVLGFAGFLKLNSVWECQCDCGARRLMTVGYVNSKRARNAKRCRCGGKPPKPKPPKKHVGRLITFNGETLNLAEWAKRLGITRERMRMRVNNMPLELAMDPERSVAIYNEARKNGQRINFRTWQPS